MKTFPKFLFALFLLILFNRLKAQEIFQAIGNGEYEKVEHLITDDPNLVDTMIVWNTPLIIASYYGKDKIVELLLERGADMYKFKHENGMLGIHIASNQSHTAVVDVFIKKGVDVNVKDGENKTALYYAIRNNNRELADLLLKNNAVLPTEQELLDQCLLSAVRYSFQDIAETLMKEGASLSALNQKGQGVLHNAVIGNNLKWIDLLLDRKTNCNLLDRYSRTPLHYSVEQNQFEISERLLQQGAKINGVDCTKRTPLNLARGLGHSQLATLLTSKGAIVVAPQRITINGNEESEVKVTYIANMGVLVSSASKTVLIDALFDKHRTYTSPAPKILSKIHKQEAPFNSIDLILVTHNHSDHFSAPIIAKYLATNLKTKVICSNVTSSELKDSISSNVDSSRIIGITPNLYKSVDTLVNDTHIKALRLRHSGSDGTFENIGFLVDMEGTKVFHSGDSSGNIRRGSAIGGIQEYDSIGIADLNIDVAILNRGSLWSSNSPGLQIIKSQMKPKHIILTHFSENNKQGEWETVEKTINEHAESLPGVTEFKWPMQELVIQKK